jgi:hypothetical protein
LRHRKDAKCCTMLLKQKAKAVKQTTMKKNIFPILTLFILTVFIFSCNGKAIRNKNVKNIYKDELEIGTWETDEILGLDPNTEKFILTKFVSRKFAGFLTNFSEKMNFSSCYTAFCGNDIFTDVFGKYEFFDKDKISITVDSVTYSGGWEKPTEVRKKKDLVYLISKIDNKIILTKQNE